MAVWLWFAVDWIEPFGSGGFALHLVSFFAGAGVLLANASITLASLWIADLNRTLRVINALAGFAVLAGVVVVLD
jgi:hypothetical protein